MCLFAFICFKNIQYGNWKACVPYRVPGVQIPLSPPKHVKNLEKYTFSGFFLYQAFSRLNFDPYFDPYFDPCFDPCFILFFYDSYSHKNSGCCLR